MNISKDAYANKIILWRASDITLKYDIYDYY